MIAGLWRKWRGGDDAASAARPADDPTNGERIYAVGDIHGQTALLERLQALIEADARQRPRVPTTLVYLGDYIDRGPNSAQVIDLVARKPAGVDRIVALLGNHEEMLLGFLDDPSTGGDWRLSGGPATLASYGLNVREMMMGKDLDKSRAQLVAAMPEAHRRFYESLALTHRVGNYFFCHAGVKPGVPLERQVKADLIWIRQEFLEWKKPHGAIIVHGHSPVPKPECLPNRINVDTGAWATGKLTCVRLEGDEIQFIST